jgi:hypothetical protein
MEDEKNVGSMFDFDNNLLEVVCNFECVQSLYKR